jgi:hypothetical protein
MSVIPYSTIESAENTEIIVDLIGPIIDISKIPAFNDIPDVRYLHESEIVDILNRRNSGNWNDDAVFKRIINTLNAKSCISILNKEILILLVKAKRFASIKIVSRVSDNALFNAARARVVDYSKKMCDQLNKKNEEIGTEHENFVSLSRNDFIRIDPKIKLAEWLSKECSAKNAYRIMFDDEVDVKISTALIQEWVSGISDKNYIPKLKEAIDRRERIDTVGKDLSMLVPNHRKQILLKNYAIDKNFKFYVFENEIRNKLCKNIDSIETIIKKESDNHDKPICVFLAGSPGTGKSYFVEQLAVYLKAGGEYPTASLSGVPENDFANAVKNHIDTVYDRLTNQSENIHIAFLDEIDTKGNELAFRLLMDAMTGDATDNRGIRKTEHTKKLVWLFAGSAGLNRDEFIEYFREKDRKVIDFFDRIHFDIILPSVQKPGQAILTFLSSLDRPRKTKRIKVSRSVLYLFGRTTWKSARQIKTICRIACAKDGFNWNDINLGCFNGIDISIEFANSYEILMYKEKIDKKYKEKINVVFPD